MDFINSNKQYHPAEQNLSFVPSVFFEGWRLRFIGSRIYYRPPAETFHEFIEYLACQIIGEHWLRKQQSSPHQLWQFAEDYNARKKNESLIDMRKEPDGSISAIPTGPNLFWLLFCYDLFVLTHKRVLPDDIIKKIKDQQHFQGARYELAVAAIFLRAGFDIQWIDKNKAEGKTCEFVATHKKTGIKVEVEAKSKKRKELNSNQGISSLLKDALKKKSIYGVPVIIFIDANLPFTPGVYSEKPIFNEIKRAVGILEGKDNLVVITNFPFHYGKFDSVAHPPENVIIYPPDNAVLDKHVFSDIQNSLNTYSIIPEEI